MSDKKGLLILVALVAMLMFSNIAIAANGFKYVSGIEPHTRYNPQLEGCYYYYGYGSCTVAKTHCQGVSIGKDRALNLGDACKRNLPPTLNTDLSIKNMEEKQTIYINRLSDVTVKEGQKVIINIECIDEDPITIEYSGWTKTKITQTYYNDAGVYTQKIICTDSFKAKAEGEFKITIVDQNRPPLFKLFDWQVGTVKTNTTLKK